jgi:hypothetical protein
VVEVKTAVPDVQAMLYVLDRKVRIAPQLASARGWRATSISKLLVVAEAHRGTPSDLWQTHSRLARGPFDSGWPIPAFRSRHWRVSCFCQRNPRLSRDAVVGAAVLGPLHGTAAKPRHPRVLGVKRRNLDVR